ncbi:MULTISPECIES: VIT family protein [unclassified Variovorax]|jgi:VIT1/CCC1 family predicted Fe2+/Mn2+ transporter|uniref:VIT1/CCC1 transporter family protein n=1 Tax=unclassified Variovorax TaxID=663243 RepID=UPI002B227550|nr:MULTISPECIES: VIT family protein [unclassified Variovorax]MEB0055910.1 VIT family protein [Variovorax sp. LG9.2]MEB0112809.1 VIT family protein [Variovorax sp. RTB1]
MKAFTRHHERHRSESIGWLRAAVLGANDGIVSTSSLILGVAAAHGTPHSVLVAGLAGLVAGAMSMAAGEYVSVHSQADTEAADLRKEMAEIDADSSAEHRELAAIYVGRGLDRPLAAEVARQLMAHDALGAHARDELGISTTLSARPVQAALASAASFSIGAALPLLVAWLASPALLIALVVLASLAFSALLGVVSARAGGAPVLTAAWRVTFWAGLAMAITFGIGSLFGVAA